MDGGRSRRRWAAAFEDSPTATVTTTTDGVVVDVNPAATRLLGRAAEDLVGRSVRDVVVQPDRAAGDEQVARRESGADRGTFYARVHTAGPDPTWARITWVAHPATDDDDGWVSVFLEDATSHAEQVIDADAVLSAIESERAALTATLDASPDGMALLRVLRDDAGQPFDVVLVRLNAAGAPPGGEPAHAFAGRRLLDYLPEARDTGLFDAVLEAARTGRRGRLLVETDAAAGWRGAFENVVVPIDADRVLCSFRDVTQSRIEEQRLLHAATHDALTGLPNRALLRDRIEHGLQRGHRDGTRMTLAFMDLDGFKAVNDSYGHPAGDVVLREVADRLLRTVREHDTVARLGGDEFVLALEDCPDESAWSTVYERLVDALSAPFVVAGDPVTLRASVGVVLVDGADVDALLRDADIAMYASKTAGRGRYTVFTEQHRRSAVDQHMLEADLGSALAARQFELHYQPIVDVRSSGQVGAEALLRWRHPSRGLVAPASFLPVAEASGLVVEIGAWVLDEAVAHVAGWRRRVAAVTPPDRLPVVTVNVSAQQLVRSDFAALVAEVLARHRVEGEALVVELTESQMLPSSSSVLDQLAALRTLGVQVAVDDFGTGYSSLAHLTELPVDVVKIDRGFIEGIADARREAVLRSTVSMVSALGARCVVEGVETTAQRDMVTSVGADLMQGFLLGRPAPAGASTGD